MCVLVYVHKSFSLVGTRGHMNSHMRALNLSGEIKKLIVVSPEGFDVQREPQMRKPIAACWLLWSSHPCMHMI